MKKHTPLLACLLLLMPFVGFAQKIDERLLQAVNQLELKYKFEEGALKFKQPVGKRTQILYVDNSVDVFDKMEIRQIYAIVHESDSPIDQAKLQKLLLLSGKKKLGAFELIERDGAYFVVFTAKVPANLDTNDLKAVMDIVATTADDAEEKIFFVDKW